VTFRSSSTHSVSVPATLPSTHSSIGRSPTCHTVRCLSRCRSGISS
jgi:hypothetical protein